MCQVSSIDLVICILVFHDPTKMSMYFIYPLVGRRSLRPTRGIMSEVASLAPTYKTRQDKTRQDKTRQGKTRTCRRSLRSLRPTRKREYDRPTRQDKTRQDKNMSEVASLAPTYKKTRIRQTDLRFKYISVQEDGAEYMHVRVQ